MTSKRILPLKQEHVLPPVLSELIFEYVPSKRYLLEEDSKTPPKLTPDEFLDIFWDFDREGDYINAKLMLKEYQQYQGYLFDDIVELYKSRDKNNAIFIAKLFKRYFQEIREEVILPFLDVLKRVDFWDNLETLDDLDIHFSLYIKYMIEVMDGNPPLLRYLRGAVYFDDTELTRAIFNNKDKNNISLVIMPRVRLYPALIKVALENGNEEIARMIQSMINNKTRNV